ncbi:hypothetical protein DY000_02008184 [Brassica cretica]|uniref:Uncharacterized protein n=1 Tax=Brassica cretica TaxID=69181 RepID=A0ABQ7C5S4_BRACR|nr:hypothetical protein DY000_02008184 [Brassica cretica]
MWICCSDHDVSRCLSEHGGTLLMSCRSWAEPVSRVVDVLQGAYIFIWLILIAGISLSWACRRRRSSRYGTLPWRLWNCQLCSRTSQTPFFRSYVLEYFLFLSDLGRYPLVQTGNLIKGRFPFILRQDKSLGLEAGGWRQGPRLGGRDPDPGAGTQTRGQGPRPWGSNPGPGGRNLEAGRWRLRELHRSIKFLVEFGVGRLPVAWAIKLYCR